MAAVTTERLMQIALEMAGWGSIPGDCAIYYPGTRISHALMGIDAGAAELFMARQLGYHAVIAHHPAGYAGPFWDVYHLHVGQMVAAGVPADVAERAVAARIEGFIAASQRENYDHAASVARLLEIPFLNIHSPLDEVGRRIMQRMVDEQLARQPDATVAEVRDALLGLPEFAAARTQMQVPLGAWDAPAGRGGRLAWRVHERRLSRGPRLSDTWREYHLLHPLPPGGCAAAGCRGHSGQYFGDGPHRWAIASASIPMWPVFVKRASK